MTLFHILSLIIAIGLYPILRATQALNITTTPNTIKPECQRQCGNITIPYPFGIGGAGCSLNSWYDILCDTNYNPPRAYSTVMYPQKSANSTMIEVFSISDTQIRVKNQFVAYACFNSSGLLTTNALSDIGTISYSISSPAPYRLSATANRFTVVGCNDYASLGGGASSFELNQAQSSCPAKCSSPELVVAGKCDGIGCCEATIQNGYRYFSVYFNSNPGNHTHIQSWNPCGYAFVGEQGAFKFRGTPDLNESYVNFMDRVQEEVPVVLDWVIGSESCSQASKNLSNYMCLQPNTLCVDADLVLGGYHCSCRQGYKGNPYLPPGCADIDECADQQLNQCSMQCVNTVGSYFCTCPSGYSGDGRKDGTRCKRVFPTVPVALGATFGLLFLMTVITLALRTIRDRRLMRKRNKLFQQNGGFLLKQLRSNEEHSPKIFTIKELMAATNNFSEQSIIGKGGYGTVYKGVLPGNQVAAIKKSKIADETQIEQFINELVILTRINHPNIVRLLGCCLESEVPLLVYEFISNGTLYDHIHSEGNTSWSSCLRIATESAKALAYLHSIPIIHRDIKSTNILLDENNAAKIADFGISRLFPVDRTRLATLVQGTLGYLDPEYFLSSQLTTKSDVYSFGVVLAELLTRKAPFIDERHAEEGNLAMHFLKSMKAGRLAEIADYRLVKEATQDQLLTFGQLIQSCLSMKGEERPTMIKAEAILEGLLQASSLPVEYMMEKAQN